MNKKLLIKTEKFLNEIKKLLIKTKKFLPKPSTYFIIFIAALLSIALALFIVGLFSPVFTIKKFFIFNNTLTMYSGLIQLFQEGYYALFLLIFTFSVLFPLLKLSVLFYVLFIKSKKSEKRTRLLHWLELVGKWSMLDVFVVAIMVVAVKIGSLVNVQVHYGIYLFAASILLMMIIPKLIYMHNKNS